MIGWKWDVRRAGDRIRAWRGWPPVFAAGLVLACLGFLSLQALREPGIAFLRPTLRGEWIVGANTRIRFRGERVSPDAVFSHTLRFDRVPERYPVRVSARGGFTFEINGAETASSSPGAWKTPVSLDLGPVLVPGDNTLRFTVGGIDGPPALLVEGNRAVRTGPDWTVRGHPGGSFEPAARALRDERFMRDPGNPLWGGEHQRTWRALLTVYVLFIAYALVPRRWKPWLAAQSSAPRPETAPARSGPNHALRWVGHGLCFLVFAVAAVAHFRNATAYDHRFSPFDVAGHRDYILHVGREGTVPKAVDGWEMFQPPLYYFASAALLRLRGEAEDPTPEGWKSVQYLTTASGLLGLAACWALMQGIFPRRPLPRVFGLSVAAMAPVGFYMYPMVTNEVFAGGVTAAAITAACLLGPVSGRAWAWTAAAAALTALALLSKFTGFFLFLALGVTCGFRLLAAPRDRRAWLSSACLLIVLAGAGWYYARNVAEYGKPFVGNWDEASGFRYHQHPGYRTAPFYLRFGASLTGSEVLAREAGFWDGQHGTFWADAHGALRGAYGRRAVPEGDRPDFEFWSALIRWLALLPAAALIAGVVRAARQVVAVDWRHPLLPLLLVSLFMVTGVIHFSLVVPTYSTIKAFFMLSLLPAVAVFSGLGFEVMDRNLGRLRFLPGVFLALLFGLVLYLYRYPAA